MFTMIPGLTNDQIDQIQRATEEILESEGFHVTHPVLLKRCRQAGARVDESAGRVRFPAALVRELLAQAPATFAIADFAGRETVIGDAEQHGLAIVTDPWIIDYDTRQPRRPCLADIRRHTIVAQQLPGIVASSRMDFPVTDVDGPCSSLRALEEYFLHHDKHLFAFVTSLEGLRHYYELAEILLGRPLAGSKVMTVAVAPLTPLALTDFNAELLLRTVEHGFAVIPTVCPMAGATAPYSLAGTLLMGNVENVFMAALTQLLNPGNPFLYAFGPSTADMRSGHDLYYTLDKVLWKIAGAQMARAYGLPSSVESGGSMTAGYDQQSGAEGMLFMLAAHAAGAHLLAGFGSCYNAIGMSGEMQVIHAAWLHAAQFLHQGIRFDGGRLGMENIKAAGPGSTFLMDDLTLEHLHDDEFFTDDLFDYSGGFAESTPLLARAHAKVEALVNNFVSPWPEEKRRAIREYFATEYNRLGEPAVP